MHRLQQSARLARAVLPRFAQSSLEMIHPLEPRMPSPSRSSFWSWLLAAIAGLSIPRVIGRFLGNSNDLKDQIALLKKELRRERKRTRRLEQDNKALVNSFGKLYANREIYGSDTPQLEIKTIPATNPNEKWVSEDYARSREKLKREALTNQDTYNWLKAEAETSDIHAELLAEVDADLGNTDIDEVEMEYDA
jgi:hypothetical protein